MTKNPLAFKFGLIALVLLMAALFAFPPSERIALGLDLRGGAHVLLQVGTRAALKYQVDTVVNAIGQRLKDQGLRYEAVLPTADTALEVRGTDPARRDDVRREIDAIAGGWTIDGSGDGSFRLTMPTEQRQFYEKTAIETTLSTIRTRFDALGVSEPLVQQQGADRILVQLPGVEDPGRVKRLMQEAALLEWKAVSYPPGVQDFARWVPPADPQGLAALFGGSLPDDTQVFVQKLADRTGGTVNAYWPLKRVSTVTGSDLRGAYRSTNEWGEPAVSFQLTQDAGRRFEVATRENVGRKMCIILGGPESKSVVSCPEIRETIRDSGIIAGGFGLAEAEELALKLRSGALPAEITVIEERTVGPSLGRDSIRSGVAAGVAGCAAIGLFMLFYYRGAGVNAVVALALNVLLVLGILGALPFLFKGVTTLRPTLTLPGIAGLILTVGMAVDTNVLIFERIREELQLGKTVRAAVQQGFSKAFATILDCHITTVSAAAVLSLYGTGPVRGFAVTLIIGLAASMFTGVFVSHQLFELVLSRKGRADTLSI